MLPFKNRLKKRKGFEAVFEKGEGFRQDLLFLKIFENNKEDSRFAFSVGKKVAKKAIIRNRIKRQLREAVRLILPEVKTGIDGVLVALPGFKEDDFIKIRETINHLFKKAELFKKQ